MSGDAGHPLHEDQLHTPVRLLEHHRDEGITIVAPHDHGDADTLQADREPLHVVDMAEIGIGRV